MAKKNGEKTFTIGKEYEVEKRIQSVKVKVVTIAKVKVTTKKDSISMRRLNMLSTNSRTRMMQWQQRRSLMVFS